MSLDGSCDCPEQDRTPLPRPTFRRVGVRLEALDMQHASHQYAAAQTMRSESGNPCQVCGRGAGDAFICAQCAEQWEVHLGNVPSLVEDLTIAAQKRVRFGGREGNPTAATGGYDPTKSESVQPRHLHTRHPSHVENPLPVDLHATDQLAALQVELVAQTLAMCDTFSLDVPDLGSDTAAISRWLLCQADNLRRMDDAHGLVADLDHAMHRGVNAIDAPERSKYVCQCTCGLAVWAPPGESIIVCVCGHAYDVETTRAKRLLTAHDYLLTVREAHTLSSVPQSTIKSWIKRGRLTIRGTRTDRIEAMYGEVIVKRKLTLQIVRYGDVVNLIEDTPQEDLTQAGASSRIASITSRG